MESLTDYEILNNDTSSLSSTFIVKHKATSKFYTMQSLPCSNFSENALKILLKKIKIRTNLTHPNILEFFDHIQLDNVIYLKQEFCEHGNLMNFIQKECKEKERQLHENLICRFLYQTALTLKTVECFMGELNLETIYLTKEFNIKLYNFVNFDANQKQKEVKMSQLGIIIYELCTLKTFEKSSFENELEQQHDYTQSFKELVISMIKDSSEIKKHINKILCHPTVLLQSSQWTKESSFLEKTKNNVDMALSKDIMFDEYSEKLEKLRKKEAGLKLKEQLLKVEERKLANKEKKLLIMERNVKEKLQQAELYLKRCREAGKSISSGSSRSSSQSFKKHISEENDDPNYVKCGGDSVILTTSSKLQVDKIKKPQNFSRTLSEKRIRFKTSPLKELNVSRKATKRRSLRHSKILEEQDIENIVPKSEECKDIRRKTLFMSAHNEYQNDHILTINNKTPLEVNNLGWTEETKRYAFEMLRMMNENEDKEDGNIKHTYL